MRLIKRVKLFVAALIPPNQGIRGTLSTSGLSRVVTADPGYPIVIIRQDPQSVAITTPMGSTGVFELDLQSELLYPFEGMGVDANWFFELPPAGNNFDFSTLHDVIVTIDYTAIHSYELREQVIKQLPRRWTGNLLFSVRRDFPDIWYDLSNLTPDASPSVELTLNHHHLPPGLSELAVDQFAIAVFLVDGSETKINVTPRRKLADGEDISIFRNRIVNINGIDWIIGSQAELITGLASSQQGNNIEYWRTLGKGKSIPSDWHFEFNDVGNSGFSFSDALKNSKVDDIFIIFTAAGLRSAWH